MMLSHDQGLSHPLVYDVSYDQSLGPVLVYDVSHDQALGHVLAHEETNYKMLMTGSELGSAQPQLVLYLYYIQSYSKQSKSLFSNLDRNL